jgi:polysaccharide biosynthesis/export protein
MVLPIRNLFIIISMFLIGLTSCVNQKELQYFQGDFDSTALSKYNIPEPIIQPNDLLSILIYSDNPEATTLYNQPSLNQTGNANANVQVPITGYLVDSDGNIFIQGVGKVKVAGLTKIQLIQELGKKFEGILQNPHFNVRFLNFRVTVLGDVVRPGVYTIPTERVNVLEAIGLAGDLTIFGKRENILLVREINGKREFARLDLTDPDIFKSPYFYLRQNDMIYVDFHKRKATMSDQVTVRNIGIATSVLSSIAILIALFKN